jgi:putative DNA-invertase from lambdoid prophage Rac
MSTIAYYRVSTSDQSIESQRAAMGGSFDDEFDDVGVTAQRIGQRCRSFCRFKGQPRARCRPPRMTAD